MIADQQAEIADLKAIRQRDFGSAETPAEMHPETMRNSGTMSTAQLRQSEQIERDFIDSMIPHHAGAIPLGSTVVMRSSHAELREMARKMTDAQSMEIGEMHEMRMMMFGASSHMGE